ncbi:MAG: hypothetical protein SFW66_06630 [Gammaproteobacteria bacterium]|nr:hypothetical protein [Gammaproteobacteria bacterium]
MLRLIFLFFLVMVISACTIPQQPKNLNIIPHRSTEYLNAKNLPPLKMPAGTPAATETKFPIPAASTISDKNVDLTPPGLY